MRTQWSAGATRSMWFDAGNEIPTREWERVLWARVPHHPWANSSTFQDVFSCFKMATSLWVDLSSYIPWLRQYKTIYHESNYSFSFSFDHLIQNPSSFQTKKCFQRHPAAVRTLCFCVSVFLYSRADRERDYSGELNLTGGEKRDNDNHNHTVRWCQRSYGG